MSGDHSARTPDSIAGVGAGWPFPLRLHGSATRARRHSRREVVHPQPQSDCTLPTQGVGKAPTEHGLDPVPRPPHGLNQKGQPGQKIRWWTPNSPQGVTASVGLNFLILFAGSVALAQAATVASEPAVLPPDVSTNQKYWMVEDAKEREKLPLYLTIPAAKPEELTPANGYPKPETFLTWHRSHGDNSGARYSALDQINRQNVTNLQVAWIYHSKDGSNAIQCNPIIVRDVMIVPTPGKFVVGVNAENGQELWRFKPEGRPGISRVDLLARQFFCKRTRSVLRRPISLCAESQKRPGDRPFWPRWTGRFCRAGRRMNLAPPRPGRPSLTIPSWCPDLKRMSGDLTSCRAGSAGPFIPCRTPANLATTPGIARKVTGPTIGPAWRWMRCAALLTSPRPGRSRISSGCGIAATIFLPIA